MSSLCTVIDRKSFSHGRKASDIFWPRVNKFYIALVGKDPRVKGSLWMHFWFVGTNFGADGSYCDRRLWKGKSVADQILHYH